MLYVIWICFYILRRCSYLYGALQSEINLQKKSFDPQLSAAMFSQVITSPSCRALSAVHKGLVTWHILIIIDIESGIE